MRRQDNAMRETTKHPARVKAPPAGEQRALEGNKVIPARTQRTSHDESGQPPGHAKIQEASAQRHRGTNTRRRDTSHADKKNQLHVRDDQACDVTLATKPHDDSDRRVPPSEHPVAATPHPPHRGLDPEAAPAAAPQVHEYPRSTPDIKTALLPPQLTAAPASCPHPRAP